MSVLNVEIINNSKVSAKDVYIGFDAKSVSGTVNSKKIKTIDQGKWYSLSTLTSNSIVIDAIDGGRIYVSFDKHFDASKGMPSFIDPGSKAYDIRFDKVELAFDGSASAVGDLTSIDFWAIPLSLKTLDSAGKEVAQLNGIKPGCKSSDLKSDLKALSLTKENTALGKAVVKAFGKALPTGVSSAITAPASAFVENGSDFVRIIGPNSFPNLGNPAASKPFPGLPFTAYGNLFDYLSHLKALPSAKTGFANIAGKFAGTNVPGDTTDAQAYDVQAMFDGSGADSALILTGTRTPASGQKSVKIEVSWWDLLSPSAVYGGSPAITVNGQVHSGTNDVFAWILGDFFAGLNIGAIGSPMIIDVPNGFLPVAELPSSDWFALLPREGLLFGALWPDGTPTREPFWNVWAATLNSRSDAYNFAYSERFAAPQIGLDPARVSTLQVIIEPDT